MYRTETGRAEAYGHAGEILQGSVACGGEVKRFLVSLPAPTLRSKAQFQVRARGGLRVFPAWKTKGLRAAEIALHTFGGSDTGGVLRISNNIPVGRGLGSSTSDCVAAIRAAARVCGECPTAEEIAAIAHRAEHASDSTMFESASVAFLHCEGRVYRYLPRPLPHMAMLVVDTTAHSAGVNTDCIPRPDYDHEELVMFERLLRRLESAVDRSDLFEIGAVATASAEANQTYLPKAHFAATMRIAERTSAHGVAAAHSGTVLTLLYDADLDKPTEAAALLRAAGLHCLPPMTTRGLLENRRIDQSRELLAEFEPVRSQLHHQHADQVLCGVNPEECAL